MSYLTTALEVKITALICEHCGHSISKCDECDKEFKEGDEIFCHSVGHLCFGCYVKETPKDGEDFDYCTDCEREVNQVEVDVGSFGCPHYRRDDCIEIRKREVGE